MRIISGKFKGRSLIAPPEGTRPTADRAKEMFFDMLSSLLMKEGKRWENLKFADVFAGSGAVGLEAISRGCRKVSLFENNSIAQKIIRQNGKGMAFELLGDALKPLPAKDIREIAANCRVLITMEEHNVLGGLGGAIAEELSEMEGNHAVLYRFGLQDCFTSEIGDQEYLRKYYFFLQQEDPRPQ